MYLAFFLLVNIVYYIVEKKMGLCPPTKQSEPVLYQKVLTNSEKQKLKANLFSSLKPIQLTQIQQNNNGNEIKYKSKNINGKKADYICYMPAHLANLQKGTAGDRVKEHLKEIEDRSRKYRIEKQRKQKQQQIKLKGQNGKQLTDYEKSVYKRLLQEDKKEKEEKQRRNQAKYEQTYNRNKAELQRLDQDQYYRNRNIQQQNSYRQQQQNHYHRIQQTRQHNNILQFSQQQFYRQQNFNKNMNNQRNWNMRW